MEPRTTRTIGSLFNASGLVGLAFALTAAVLVGYGSSDPPQTIVAVWVPIQSAINVMVGWSLRRGVDASGG